MSGVCFCELLVAHTRAEQDQEHLNFLLSSRADTPDRTAFILGRSHHNPLPVMREEVHRLIDAGAELIAIPCNTAHYFYDSIQAASSVPVINIIDQTVELCLQNGYRKVGVLATEGTVASGAYESVCRAAGIEYCTCSPEDQAIISHIIYDQIKQGKTPDLPAFLAVAETLRRAGCDTVILGCTELSLLKRDFGLGSDFLDSLEVLACASIRLCGKTPVGFDAPLLNYTPRKEKLYVAP